MLRDLEAVVAQPMTTDNIATLGPVKHKAGPMIEAVRRVLFPEDDDG